MIKILHSLDFFSKKFSLNSKNRSRSYNTATGGLFTMIAFTLFSIVTYIAISDYLDTTKPVVSVNRIKMEKPERINLFKNDIIGAYSIFTTVFFTKEETRKFMTTRVEIVTTEEDNEGNTIESSKFYDSNVVDDLKHPELKELGIKGLRESNKDLDLYTIFSKILVVPDIPPEEFWITGSKFNLPYRRLRISVFPCSLPNS